MDISLYPRWLRWATFCFVQVIDYWSILCQKLQQIDCFGSDMMHISIFWDKTAVIICEKFQEICYELQWLTSYGAFKEGEGLGRSNILNIIYYS